MSLEILGIGTATPEHSIEQLDAADLALRPCRVETAIGCAFINFDEAAPSLRESLGPVLEALEMRWLELEEMTE